MSQYAIPLRVKLSEKEYDKLKHATNKSQYVRTAINFYDAKQPQEIELAKKRLLDDIIKEVKKENRKAYEKTVKNEKMRNKRIMNKLDKMCRKCDEELMKLAKEMSDCENTCFETFDSQTCEEKILSILPTLQGIYHSDVGLEYESIRRQAVNIGISAKELKNWIDDNPELMNASDYLYREPEVNCRSNKKYRFEHYA